MSSNPTVIDLCRAKGDTFAIQFTIKTEDGVAVPIDGASFLLSVDPSPDPDSDATRLFQIIGIIVDGPNGIVSFRPTPADAAFGPDTFFYDVEMTDGSGFIRTVANGQYVVGPQVTQ